MTRGQRRFHAMIWPILALLVAGVFICAVIAHGHALTALELAAPR